MKTTLLLTEEAETATLMLKDVAFDPLQVREPEARAGCNCDRWGHPCAGYNDRKSLPDGGRLISPEHKQTKQTWNA